MRITCIHRHGSAKTWCVSLLLGVLVLVVLSALWLYNNSQEAIRQDAIADVICGEVGGKFYHDSQPGYGFSIETDKGVISYSTGSNGSWFRWQMNSGLGEDIFRRVAFVDLSDTAADDKLISSIDSLKDMYMLSIRNTAITNMGVKLLVDINELKILDLSGTEISDDVFDTLNAIKKLEVVVLQDLDLSDDAINRFRRERPGCEVFVESPQAAKR